MTTLTPDEAKVQPCPFFRYCINERGVVADGHAAIYIHEPCKGPDCKIGWRWTEPAAPRFFVTPPGKPEEEWSWNPHDKNIPRPRDENYDEATVRVVEDERRGYCGFAGRP